MEININNDRLVKDIRKYCELNSLNVEDYISSLLKKAFMLEKYGERPPLYGVKTSKETPVEVEREKKETTYTVEVEIPKKKKRKATTKKKEEIKVKEEEKPISIDQPKEAVGESTKEDIKPKRRKLSVK
jgi:hypothetical protein